VDQGLDTRPEHRQSYDAGDNSSRILVNYHKKVTLSDADPSIEHVFDPDLLLLSRASPKASSTTVGKHCDVYACDSPTLFQSRAHRVGSGGRVG